MLQMGLKTALRAHKCCHFKEICHKLRRSCFLKHVIVSERQKKRHKGRDDEEEDVRNCWITLRNREATGT